MSVADPSRTNAVPPPPDQHTADAFARSWNNLPAGSVYTADQFEDWMGPLRPADIQGKEVLELWCGNGSLLVHLAAWSPSFLEGVELGDSVSSATANLRRTGFDRWRVSRADLTTFGSTGYDVVLCIGVLHHLDEPDIDRKTIERWLASYREIDPATTYVIMRNGNSWTFGGRIG